MAKNNKSIYEQVCDLIKKQKLLPMPVQTLNEEAESTRYFGGDLKEFLAAAKALGAKGIFVETLYLEDDEFYYDSGIDDEEYLAMNGCGCNCGCGCCDCECCKNGTCNCGEDCKCGCQDKKAKKSKKKDDEEADGIWLEPEDLDGIDLSLLRPEIDKYSGRIGEACGARLTVPGVDHLEVEIFTEWYDKFAELVDEASEIIELDPNKALADMQAAFQAEEEAIKAAQAKSVKKIAVHPPKAKAKAKK